MTYPYAATDIKNALQLVDEAVDILKRKGASVEETAAGKLAHALDLALYILEHMIQDEEQEAVG